MIDFKLDTGEKKEISSFRFVINGEVNVSDLNTADESKERIKKFLREIIDNLEIKEKEEVNTENVNGKYGFTPVVNKNNINQTIFDFTNE